MTATLIRDIPFYRGSGVREYRLENGLVALLLPSPDIPIVAHQTWFKVGSSDEQPGRTGMAHFLEHLMFSKTPKHPAGRVDRKIEQLGGDTNAATWLDWTYYRNTLPCPGLSSVLELEADRMHNLALDDATIETERSVILNERRERVDDDIDGRIDEAVFELAYNSHPYRWPTIGWERDIRAITRSDLEAFYGRFYAPNNATVIVVGGFDESVVLLELEQLYGSIPPSELPRRPPVPVCPPPERVEREVFDEISCDRLVLAFVGPPQGDPAWLHMELIANLLAGSPSSRLHQDLVDERELATSVSASILPLAGSALVEISVVASPGERALDILPLIEEHLSALRRIHCSEAEIAKNKNCLLTDFWTELVSVDSKAEALGHQSLVLGNFANLFETPAAIQRIGRDAIREAATRYLTMEHAVIVFARGGATP